MCHTVTDVVKSSKLHGWKDGSIKPYIKEVTCKMCIIDKRSSGNSNQLYTTYQCIEQCPTKKVTFNIKNGFKSLL